MLPLFPPLCSCARCPSFCRAFIWLRGTGSVLYATSSSWAVCERWKVTSSEAALCLLLPGMVCCYHSDGEGPVGLETTGQPAWGCAWPAGAVGITRATTRSEDLVIRSDGPSSEETAVDMPRCSTWRLGRWSVEIIEWHSFQSVPLRGGGLQGAGVMWSWGVTGRLQLPPPPELLHFCQFYNLASPVKTC